MNNALTYTMTDPTPFDCERARAILLHASYQIGVDRNMNIAQRVRSRMTLGEIKYVHLVWKMLRPGACWFDAFCAIRNEEIPHAEND